jgi:hypothetical protein
MPGLFGLVVISLLLGGMAASLFRRPRLTLAAMTGSILAGVTTPWAFRAAGWPVQSFHVVLAVMLAVALLVACGLALLGVPQRKTTDKTSSNSRSYRPE